MLTQQWTSILQDIQVRLPELLLAIGLIVIGLILAFLLRSWVSRLMTVIDRFLKQKVMHNGDTKLIHSRTPGLAGQIIFWLVFFFFLASALKVLGHPIISSWSKSVTDYLPSLLAAIFVFFMGLFLSKLAGAGVQKISYGAKGQSEVLRKIVQFFVLTLFALIAVDQVGIQTNTLITLLAILIGSIALAISLTFALGAKTAASNIIASHYVSLRYRKGQNVRIGEIEGRILEISATEVAIETQSGLSMVPASHFSKEISTVLKGK
jgi:hypothetical protein